MNKGKGKHTCIPMEAMGDSIVLTRDSSENPMKQTEILGYCQFAINCRGNTDITIAKESEVVNLRLINTGFEPRKRVFTNPTQQETLTSNA